MDAALLIRYALFAAFFVGSAAVSTAAEDAEKLKQTDRDKLQGKWQIMSFTLQKKTYIRDKSPAEWRIVFENDVKIDGDQVSHTEAAESKFKLDETRSPKQITLRDRDDKVVLQGTYSLVGDTLKIWAGGDGNDVIKETPPLFTLKKAAEK